MPKQGEPMPGTFADVLSSLSKQAAGRVPELAREEFQRAITDELWTSHLSLETIVRRILAVRSAREQRPDIDADTFGLLLDLIPVLEDSEAIVRHLDALRPEARALGRPGPPPLREEDVLRDLESALEILPDNPTRQAIAYTIGIDPKTLRRRLDRFPDLEERLLGGRPSGRQGRRQR